MVLAQSFQFSSYPLLSLLTILTIYFDNLDNFANVDNAANVDNVDNVDIADNVESLTLCQSTLLKQSETISSPFKASSKTSITDCSTWI